MELDNLIYIIITVAIFIISLIGQTKKNKPLVQQHQEDDIIYSLNDFEKILERKEEYRKNEEVEDQPVASNTKITNSEPVEKSNELVIPEKKEVSTENEENDGFDIRSAVIYSSILERKKFRH